MTKKSRHGGTEAPPRPESLLPVGTVYDGELPDRLRRAYGTTDIGVWSVAFDAYNNVVDIGTGKPWADGDVDDLAIGALEQTAAQCQKWAADRTEDQDREALRTYEEAAASAAGALDWIEHTDTVLDEVVDGTEGATTARRLISDHERDQVLATQREADGDTRHRKHRIEHVWVVIAAFVLALLDVFLLWKPLLGLGFQGSSDMLLKWVIGTAFAVGQALFIERALHVYTQAERDDVDRRDAVRDYNRELRRGALNPQDPGLDGVAEADRKLRTACRWLLAAALCTAVVAAVRVALLAGATGLPAVEGAVFASVVGLVLGGLVVLLGMAGARGNLLGDRLRWGRSVVAEVDGRVQEGRDKVAERREEARRHLLRADLIAAEATGRRHDIIAGYHQAMLLACSWSGADRKVLRRLEIEPRSLPVADHSKTLCRTVNGKLEAVDAWLANRPSPLPMAHSQAPLALPSGKFRLPAVRPGAGVVRYGAQHELPEEPGISPWLLAGSALVVVVAAVVAAYFAPMI
ncbi:hypothetical protein GCM10022243_18620 [Saccharothrix violaceirubra]|uniref:Putative integral membrane protein n=1 Tax=Saccharothrix violaceirubra TaxID=413306 RepID=A0A7W7T2V8_9PSEU|nr:hypothetical protein [Saccharothrix violaceirubra]MBB4965231.1 putative integral membrane protein [Saccharothrix violaceirubra]